MHMCTFPGGTGQAGANPVLQVGGCAGPRESGPRVSQHQGRRLSWDEGVWGLAEKNPGAKGWCLTVLLLPCRSLEPLDTEGPAPPVLSPFLPQVPSSSIDPPEHFPLRKTASEPNLKVRYKPKKSVDRRKNPLTRKESAPPSLKRRPAEAIDSSPSSSSTPVSGCSSPNDSLPAEHGVPASGPSMAHEVRSLQTCRREPGAQDVLPWVGSLGHAVPRESMG
uniref:histone deacetylase n=1 Tax=Terrapene triunguis TaxID=2587831 RepID=A0A674JVW0_9SAUR